MTTPARRFTLLDAMVLIAALAMGLACIGQRYWTDAEMGLAGWFIRPDGGWTIRRVLECTAGVGAEVAPRLLAPGTLALLALRLRRPRPPLKHLALHPGTAACGVAALISAVSLIGSLIARLAAYLLYAGDLRFTEGFSTGWWLSFVFGIDDAVPMASGAVLAAWMILAWSRRGRFERSWIERMELIAGGLWLIAGFCVWWSDIMSYFE